MTENYATDSQNIHDDEAEKASFAYLMSTVVLIVGLPLPIINMIASVFFYIANRKKTYFVRFHCLQSMLSQILIIAVNSVGLSWTLSIIFGDTMVSNRYIAYIITLACFNILELVASLYAAIKVRKRQDVRFWFFGELTAALCAPDKPSERKLF